MEIFEEDLISGAGGGGKEASGAAGGPGEITLRFIRTV